ncbi:MAG TPA: hypothetical protein VEY91_04280 [Candidatus Limnocylindria bacterium]|nr:hypothetical protein [Candidatus Limnocylindria bacterium]
MTDAQARTLEQRVRRERETKHLLSTPGFDWSPHAARRRGWRAPVTGVRNPHQAHVAAPQGTPPDTVRVALLRLDFAADRREGASSGTGRFDLSGPDTLLPPIDRAPRNRSFYLSHLEALRRYYDAQSYGRVVIEGDVWPRALDGAYSVSDMADFGPWKFSQDIYPAAVHMFRTMLFAADSQSIERGDRIPWDQYDRIVLIHAGSDLQSDLRQDSELDIPSFTLGVEDTNLVIFPDSLNLPIDRGAVVPETINQDGFYGALNGVLAHECGHLLFGFADLYDILTGLPVVGHWSLMDSGNLVGSRIVLANGDEIFATGLLPPSLDPFHRFFTGDGLAFNEVDYGNTMSVLASERYPDMRRTFLSSDEYLVIENRYVNPIETIELDQDTLTRVVLGPKDPDRFAYDDLLLGGGLLVWHIDASVIPFETSLRPQVGFNTNPARLGISIKEADGLGDLGDPGSPLLLESPYDPYFRSNNPSLSDTTVPDLRPHIRTRPHQRLDFLDEPDSVMHFSAARTWQLPAWPVAVDVPPGGPQLLAVDADGDLALEVCWAGGDRGGADSTALFAVRVDGQGLFGPSHVIASLDRRPHPVMAALPIGAVETPGQPPRGPAYFAATTYPDGPDLSTPGGRVWLVDHTGQPLPGWPAVLPSIATTPPVIAGSYPSASVFVGCADGRVYQLGLDGVVRAASEPPLGGGIQGRLAVDLYDGVGGRVAAASGAGEVAVFGQTALGPLRPLGTGWPKQVGGPGFTPDFLWLDFDGNGRPAGAAPVCGGERTVIVRGVDRLWAFCASGAALPGWGRALGDTLVPSLAAGDPDGDGYVEVLTQSTTSALTFWNESGYPSPGWPKRATREGFRTESPPLVVDVDGRPPAEVVGLNASGVLAALDPLGRIPAGWPLATGVGATGSSLAADLDRDGMIEIVAPDRAVPDSLRFDANGRFGNLYAYSLPSPYADPTITSWTMVGGDPGRTSSLPADRTPIAAAATPGPLVPGSLKVYPNPAKRRPVSFAFQLSEPAEVEFNILDSSGHEVAAFRRAGRRADNLEIWDPGSAPAGLYLARVRFRGPTSEHSEVVSVGVIR